MKIFYQFKYQDGKFEHGDYAIDELESPDSVIGAQCDAMGPWGHCYFILCSHSDSLLVSDMPDLTQ